MSLLQIKDFLRHSQFVQTKPNYEAVYDSSLCLSLAEFQKNKGLLITDGSLNSETFQAFGEEMHNGELHRILLHRPELKSLFINRKQYGFVNKPALQPEQIVVELNIVYNKNDFSETSARNFLRAAIEDAKYCYGKISKRTELFYKCFSSLLNIYRRTKKIQN